VWHYHFYFGQRSEFLGTSSTLGWRSALLTTTTTKSLCLWSNMPPHLAALEGSGLAYDLFRIWRHRPMWSWVSAFCCGTLWERAVRSSPSAVSLHLLGPHPHRPELACAASQSSRRYTRHPRAELLRLGLWICQYLTSHESTFDFDSWGHDAIWNWFLIQNDSRLKILVLDWVHRGFSPVRCVLRKVVLQIIMAWKKSKCIRGELWIDSE